MTRHLRNNTTRTLLLAAAMPLALNWGCDAEDAGDPQAEDNAPAAHEDGTRANAGDDRIPLRDGEERFGEGITPLHEVEVAGTRFRFLRVDNPELGAGSVAMLVSQSPDGVAVAQEPALADASMLDMFLALTDKDVPLPDELLADVDHELGPRGWFAERALRGDYPALRTLCVDANFESALTSWLPAIDDASSYVHRTTASGDANWGNDSIEGCTGCSGWYQYSTSTYPIDNADELKAAIKSCALTSHPSVGSEFDFGPTVYLGYRTQTPTAGYFWSYDIPTSELGTMHYLHWLGSSGGDNDWDFRWEITEARSGDSFSMGLVKEGHGW